MAAKSLKLNSIVGPTFLRRVFKEHIVKVTGNRYITGATSERLDKIVKDMLLEFPELDRKYAVPSMDRHIAWFCSFMGLSYFQNAIALYILGFSDSCYLELWAVLENQILERLKQLAKEKQVLLTLRDIEELNLRQLIQNKPELIR